jgi:hypothetical protein
MGEALVATMNVSSMPCWSHFVLLFLDFALLLPLCLSPVAAALRPPLDVASLFPCHRASFRMRFVWFLPTAIAWDSNAHRETER